MSSGNENDALLEQLKPLIPRDQYRTPASEAASRKPAFEFDNVKAILEGKDFSKRVLGLSIYQSLIDLNRSIVGRRANEEYQSSALAGHFLTNLRWYAKVMRPASGTSIAPAIHWVSFSKTQEAAIGADFAVISVPKQTDVAHGIVNIRLFQAKVKDPSGSFDFGHVTGDDGTNLAETKFRAHLQGTFASPQPKPYLQIHALAAAQKILNDHRWKKSNRLSNFCFYCLLPGASREVPLLPMTARLDHLIDIHRKSHSFRTIISGGMSLGWAILGLYSQDRASTSIPINRLDALFSALKSILPDIKVGLMSRTDQDAQLVLAKLRMAGGTASRNLTEYTAARGRGRERDQ